MDPVEHSSTGSFCLIFVRRAGYHQRVVRKSFKILFSLALGLIITLPAHSGSDSVNGNLIRNPELADYVQGNRAPGFSPITDVMDAEGHPAP